MKKQIKNISGIDFERDVDLEETLNLRMNKRTPTDFNQPLLSQYWGEDFFDEKRSVLEIGCGVGIVTGKQFR